MFKKILTTISVALLCTGCMQQEATKEYPSISYEPVTYVQPQAQLVTYKVQEDKPKRIRIYTHHGGKALNYHHVRETVESILHAIPNVPVVDHLTDLIIETMIVETNLGGARYHYAHKKYRNYGIGQFTLGSAKDTLKWCKKHHPKSYQVVMKYYNRKHSLVENLSSNVPFSIALISQYYLQRTNDKLSHAHLGTLDQRGRVWNRVYNTYKGSGTPRVYLARVKAYYRKHHIRQE